VFWGAIDNARGITVANVNAQVVRDSFHEAVERELIYERTDTPSVYSFSDSTQSPPLMPPKARVEAVTTA
jgi:hypothetical protein